MVRDPRRLEALRRLQIMDTPAEAAFDGLARLAAYICGTPTGAITFVDDRRQWFKAKIGIDLTETRVERGFCAHAINGDDPLLVVRDAAADPRFHDNPYVVGPPHTRFYAGAVLRCPEGHALGMLSVADTVPHELDAAQREALLTLAAQVVVLLEHGLAQREQAEVQARVEAKAAELADLNVRLRETAELAEKANRLKADFLANMSHELRTPLNAIIGFSDLMQQGLFGPVNDPYRGYAADIHRSGQLLLNLVNDLLDLSKIDAGREVLDEQHVNLDLAVRHVVGLIQPRADTKGIRLANGCASLPAIRADERRIKQILLNLLSNAVKFTASGGSVDMQAAVQPDGDLCLFVCDTGVGMTEDDIRIAFEPFGQAASHTVRDEEGTGLGLPITKRLVELHGGTIEVASRKGVGTTVTVRLPRARLDVGDPPPLRASVA